MARRAAKSDDGAGAGGKPRPRAGGAPLLPSRAAREPRARLDVDERRAQLLALGLAMFSVRTYDEVSIDDLARAAGVSKGLIYYYFPTKRDLYVAALGEAARRLLSETRSDPAGAAEERLRRGLTTYLDFVERHGQAYVALMRGGIGSDPEVATILEETRHTFATRILENLPHESKRPLVRTALRGWIGFVEATAIDWMEHRAVRREELVELLAGIIVDAVARAGAIVAERGQAAAPAPSPASSPALGRRTASGGARGRARRPALASAKE
jgi:AcrR family transcriptional regulator